MWREVEQTLDKSTIHVLSQLASLLPGMLALVVAVLFSSALAWFVRDCAAPVLVSIQFDKQLERWGFTGIAEVSPNRVRRCWSLA